MRWRKVVPVGAVITLSVALFFSFHRPEIVDPRTIDWLLSGDTATHYLGWQFFRDEPWGMPPGVIRTYMHPVGTSIGLTDSIPLLAFLLKPFSSALPAEAQYFGAWILLCWILEGVFAYLLLSRAEGRLTPKAGENDLLAITGAMIFVASPAMFHRELMHHPALCAHWTILAAFLIYRSDGEKASTAVGMALLSAVTSLIHPYLLVMVTAVASAAVVRAVRARSRRAASVSLAGLAGGLVLAIAALGAVGLFSFGAPEPDSGFGECASDLASFVNPGSLSTFLRGFPVLPCRQEGYGYLGLGGLFGVIGALVLIARRAARFRGLSGVESAPLWVVCLVMWFFSLSSLITIFHGDLVDLAWLYAPVSGIADSLRSSGRFFWPLYYVVLLWAIERLAQVPRLASWLVAACVAIQAIDLAPAYLSSGRSARERVEGASREARVEPLGRAAGGRLPGSYRHLAMVPPQFPYSLCPGSRYANPDHYVRIGRIAALSGLTFNGGFSARADHRRIGAYCEASSDALARGEVAQDTIYVIGDEHLSNDRLSCGAIEGLHVCIARENKDPFARALTSGKAADR